MITIKTTQNVETRMTNNHDGSTTFEMRLDKHTTYNFEGLLDHLLTMGVVTSFLREHKRVFSGFGFEIEIPVDEFKDSENGTSNP